MNPDYVTEVAEWSKANSDLINMLRPKLFALGGDSVSPQPDQFISLIVKDGRSFEDMPVKLRRGERNGCQLVGIGTGYGLSKDNMWRPHSWLVGIAKSQPYVIETTEPREAYFGVSFNSKGSDLFARAALAN
jgi:hypothetical protein